MKDGYGLGLGLAIMGVVALVGLAIAIGVIYLVYLAMEGVPKKQRPMESIMVFLLLIPLFNLFWAFKVFPPMMLGYKKALEEKGIPVEGDGGYNFALAFCICICVAIIPFVTALATLVALIMFILTMVKAFEFKKLLA